MPLFAGLERTEYQDVLCAVGRLMGAEGFRNFRLVEQENGLILQVSRSSGAGRGFETYLLTTEDIEALLRDTYNLRGANASGRPPAP